VAVGDRRAQQVGANGPDIVDSRSRLYPGSLHIMGWDVGSDGMQLRLSPDLTKLIEQYLAGDVTGFLGTHGLSNGDIGAWITIQAAPRSSTRSARPRTPRGGTGADLAIAGRDRQPLVGFGAAHLAGHHRQTAAQRKPRTDARHGSGTVHGARTTALALSR